MQSPPAVNALKDVRISASGLIGAHSLYLARQLASRSLLQTYYTTLPASRTAGVPDSRTHRHLALLALIYAVGRGWVPGNPKRLQLWWGYEFDRWIAARLEDTDVMHALPGCGLKLRREAKTRYGALTVCDSGTSHERFQDQLLTDEALRWGIERQRAPERHLHYVESEYEEADLITVPSSFARRSFIDNGFQPDKVVVTPYGADLDEYQPTPKSDALFRILYVGSLDTRKGVPYLLEAASALALADAELCMRGASAPETPRLLSRYNGKIPLKLVLPQARERMKDLFSQASVLVLPSVEDGFGLVIGQAMACGIPVIASTSSGGPELIDDGVEGFLVAPRDSAAIRDRLLHLYENPEARRTMGRAALAKMRCLGGWNAYGDAFISACRSARVRGSVGRSLAS